MSIAPTNNPAQAALEQLPPLALPEQISFWPPAIGWWLSALLIALVSITLLIIHRKRKQHRATLRAASIGLQTLYAVYIDDNNAQQYLYNSSQLLRRFCISRYSDSSLASMSGEPWLAAMDQVAGERLLNTQTGKQLLTMYQPNSEVDIHALHTVLLRWLASAPAKLVEKKK